MRSCRCRREGVRVAEGWMVRARQESFCSGWLPPTPPPEPAFARLLSILIPACLATHSGTEAQARRARCSQSLHQASSISIACSRSRAASAGRFGQLTLERAHPLQAPRLGFTKTPARAAVCSAHLSRDEAIYARTGRATMPRTVCGAIPAAGQHAGRTSGGATPSLAAPPR